MIKNILLPEQFKSYYLFPKRVIGIEINKNHLFATVTYFQGKNITIEQCLQVAIEQETSKDVASRTAHAIQKIIDIVGKSAIVTTSISCSQVIFKTMKLPFLDHNKIKKVINFEVEPLLPFTLNDAIVDFIITKQDIAEKSSVVLIAAIQKQSIKQIVDLFAQTKASLTSITVDMLQLYGTYKMIPQYAAFTEATILIDMGSHATKIAYIVNEQLLFIRTLTTGVAHLAKLIAEHNSTTKHDAMEELLRYGLEHNDNEHLQKIQESIEPFAAQIRFTLDSFTTQTNNKYKINQMLLLGFGATIKGIEQWMEQVINTPCSLFNMKEIATHTHITLKNMTNIAIENSISTALTLPTPTTIQFNLLQKEFEISDNRLLTKQLIVAGSLIFLLFFTLLFYSFFEIRTLKNAVTISQKEATELVVEWFPSIEVGHLDDMIQEAQEEAKKEERLWFSFDRSSKNSLLNFLLALTHLDREGLGLIFDKITINQDKGTMIIKAQVHDGEALGPLENELRQSKLFTYVQEQNEPNFTMELRFPTGPKGGEQ